MDSRTMSPYRSSGTPVVRPACVLAGPDRWGMLVRGAVAVLILSAWFWGPHLPWSLWMIGLAAVLTIPAGFELTRLAHQWLLPRRISADSRGIELSWAERVPWLPWMRPRSVAIDWDSLIDIQVDALDHTGSDTTALCIHRSDGSQLGIPRGTFALGPEGVRRAIFDERDDRQEASRREEANIARLCERRYRTSRTFHLRSDVGRRALGVGIGVGAIISAVVIGSTVVGWSHLWLTVPLALSGGVITRRFWSRSTPAVICLCEDGLAYGDSLCELSVIDWSDVRFARPTMRDARFVSLRVATAEGYLELQGDYGIALDELAALIAPSVDMALEGSITGS